MLIASMNPCPCGFYNHPEKQCVCGPGVVQKYLNKISGPLLDRIDLHLEVTPVPFRSCHRSGSRSAANRFGHVSWLHASGRLNVTPRIPGIYCNAQMSSQLLQEICVIGDEGKQLLKTAMERLGLSARAYDRILKVSRTIADLDGSEQIRTEHLAEAIQYRSLDRDGWAG